MATLAAGEKARMYALGKIARGGATRGAYRGAGCFIAIEGTHYGTGRPSANVGILMESLQISDQLKQVPNTCNFTARGFIPSAGDEIVMTIGSKNSLTRLFAGFVLRTQQVYLVENPDEIAWLVSGIDYTWALDRRLVIKRYRNQSASAIAIDLLASFTENFTTTHVVPNLATVDEISFTNVPVTSALSQLAKRIGAYYYIDYLRDLHFFLTEDANANTPPTALTPAHKTMRGFSPSKDISQWLTRAYQEGGGVNALAELAPGETIIPIEDAVWYEAGGGVVTSGPQRITYGAALAGGAGSIVGPGGGPATAPTVAGAASGGTLLVGTYRYAFTFTTAGGESLPSPVAAVVIGSALAPPTSAPAAAAMSGGSINAGDYTYSTTFVTASGETTLGSNSSSVSMLDVPAPQATYGPGINFESSFNSTLPINSYFYYRGTWVTASGGETTLSPNIAQAYTGNSHQTFALTGFYLGSGAYETPPAGAVKIRYYRATVGNNSGPWYRVGEVAIGSGLYDNMPDGTLTSQPQAPVASTASLHSTQLTAIPIGPAGVTGRNVYRWTAALGWKRAAIIADNTTIAYLDTLANAGLGPAPPATGTATGGQQVIVTGIAIGPAGTSGRTIYRTTVNGSQLRVLTTLANNTATALPANDTAADATLGANAPTNDNSGLNISGGQVLAGSPTLITSGASAFRAAGGWAILGNGQQVIRYTGISGNTLTGIPPTGSGAIDATVQYGASVTASPMLTGIPASGTGAIVERILQGDAVNLLAQVDDLTSQQSLASLVGGSGIQESYESDNRISRTEAVARANARLALRNQLDLSVSYTARDLNTRSGATIHVAFPPPTNFTGDFKIQSVTIGAFQYPHVHPTYRVEASASRFSFEDLLRLARKEST